MADHDRATDKDRAGSRPTTIAALRDAMVARRATLPKRLAQVADYAMAAPDELAFGSIAAIAARCGVQPSTLVRFGQAFGFPGFSDLQHLFRERLRDRVPSYADRLEALRAPDGGVPHAAVLLDGFTDAAIRSLETSRHCLDAATLDQAVALLANADTIYLVGQRRSFPATAMTSYLFGKLGIRHVLGGSALGTDTETIAFARPIDAAIVVSFTPYTPATVALAAVLERASVPIVAITDSPFSPLDSGGRGFRFEVAETDFQGFRALSATFALLMSLALGIAETRSIRSSAGSGQGSSDPG
ncbi:MurR/RpiR family transcriptional regulator [Lichenicoccus sp.]|uniref:MurR/RpiR family transcriptional regulator n=1 Tax=Lichenicoccus sp. TaxID=2781899 RepID=UPI003D12EBF1